MNQYKSQTITSLLQSATALYPDDVAVKGTGFSYTYQQFYAAVIRFSVQLEQAGVKRGEPVGICLDRSAEMVVGIFGILQQGAVYVPADPSHPIERVRSVFQDASVRFVVTTNEYAGFVKELGFVPLIPDIDTVSPVESAGLRVEPEDNAYILFTSGSTGKPKGVMIAHHSVVNLVTYIQNRYPLAKGDVVLLKSPYTFDGSIWELFGWLLMGGTLCVANPGDEKDPAALVRLIEKEAVSFLFFVPSMLSSFLDYYETVAYRQQLPSLRWVSVGGEVLPVALVERFYSLFDGDRVKLINVYGPTETTVYATTYLCDPHRQYTKIPIGEAVDNDFVYILNENLQPVAPGEEGEICIGGAGVGTGYLNRPELTAEKFVPDTVSGRGMMYRTGDIGREPEKGLFDFIGRRDFQVKLRGLRIEIGEIEYALLQNTSVKECTVLFSKDRHGDDCLVAYLVPYKFPDVTSPDLFVLPDEAFISEISSGLSRYLPAYMIPAEWVLCRIFPLTDNGKVDRKALPNMVDLAQDQVDKQFSPQTDAEEKIYEIWKSVLGRNAIRDDEDFFAAGGHSLKAVQVITAVIRQLGCEIPLKEFYGGVTLPAMCRWVEEALPHALPVAGISILTDDERREYPVTPAQNELWVLHSMDSTGLAHNIQIEFAIKGDIDLDKWLNALRQTIAHEEVFRSTFPVGESGPVQLIHDECVYDVPFTDLSDCDLSQKEPEYKKLCKENGNKRFYPDMLPLFSFRLIRYSSDEYRLLMAIHHLIFDGWSLQLFMAEWRLHYLTGKGTKSLYRPGDYALWLRENLSVELQNRELDYWQNVLKGITPRLNLPHKPTANKAEAGKIGARFWWTIPARPAEQLDALALSAGVTPFVVFLTAYQLVLAEISGQRDIVVGTPFANRKHPMLERIIGYYTNMVSLRTKFSANDTVDSLLAQCNETAIQAFSHAATPFGEVAKSLRLKPLKGVHPVFQSIFVMQNWPHNDNDFGNAVMTQREIGNDSCKTDLMLNAEKRGDIYELWLEYDCALFDEEFAQRLSAGINRTLDAFMQSPDTPANDLLMQLEPVVQPPTYRSCMVVGDGSLLMQCVDILQQKGFSVLTVVSSDEALREWAQKLSLPFYTSLKELSVFRPVDYIFSINNGFILKKEFTSLARHHAINYHDSPLPRYAGMYATNQAILNNEKTHAVTWHEVVDEIDAGDIFVQEKVVIKSGDSAFTLNSRCFEAAVRSFSAMLDQIVAGTLTSYRQDFSKRTYYGLSDRPASVGFPDWASPVESLRPLLRACHFGEHFDNEFLLPSVLIGGKLFFLTQSEPLKGSFAGSGMVFKHKDQWAFGCLNGCIVIQQLYDAAGNEMNPDQFLAPGMRIERPGQEYLTYLSGGFSRWIKHEPFWRNTLRSAEFLQVPFVSELMEDYVKDEWLRLPSALVADIRKRWPEYSLVECTAVFVASFMLRLSGKSEGTIGFVPSGLGQIAHESKQYWSGWLPYTVSLDGEKSLSQLFEERISRIKILQKKGTFTSNLRLRYPSLKGEASSIPSIFVVQKGEALNLPAENGLRVVFEVDENAVRICGLSKPIVDSFISVVIHVLTSSGQKSGELAIYSSPLQSLFQAKLCEPVCIPVFLNNVIAQFEAVCTQFGSREALYDRGESLSYHSFRQEVIALAAELRKNGINEGNVVAINLSRNKLYFTALMAALGCGAAFVPVDPGLPVDRQQFIAQDSGADIILHEGSLIWADFKTIDINRAIHNSRVDQLVDNQSLYLPSENDLAYIIYTSGSSGKPKGVKISHGALANFISGALGLYNITMEDRILQFSNLGFDASIEEIFSAFCSGASLYLRTDKMLSPLDLMQFSVEHKITVWDLPTAFWRQVISMPEFAGEFGESSLRLVIIGGEAVTLSDFTAWRATRPGHRLFNTYGPTETTVVALAHELKADDVYTAVGVPIGKPLPGYTIQIVDLYNQPLPAGVIGELLIAGRSVAQGYVRAEGVQDEVFGEIKDAGCCSLNSYKTGDLVVADTNGVVYYMGRKDAQVKIRGFRIEPGEIESNIRRLEEIEDCAVIPFQKKNGEKALAAFVISATQSEPDYGLMKEKLFAMMPAYMVPEIIETIESVPLTFNGKVDKKRLQAKAEKLSAAKSGFAEDSVEFISMLNSFAETLEQEPAVKEISVYLLDLVRKLADDNTIMPGDDLMHSGFDSLKFIRLIVALERDYNVRISISDIYNNQTINRLAHLIADYRPQSSSGTIVCIRKGKTGITPLVLIWGAGLYIFEFNDLAKRIHEDIPVYVMQAPIVDGAISIPDSLEELSALYISEIEKVVPSTTICLAGYSFGGFVVFEMAKQLLQSGRLKAEKLLILDTSAQFAQYKGQFKWLYKTSVIRAKLWWLITRSPLNQYRTIKKTIEERRLIYKIKKRNKAEAVAGAVAGARTQQELEFNDYLYVWSAAQIQRYIIEPADVKICLLTSESHLKFGGLYMGWKKYALKGVEPFYIHTFHADLFLDENINQLAGWIHSHILPTPSKE